MDNNTMQKLLLEIFKHAHPGYTRYRFSSMINVGLVLLGIKRGAIENIDERIHNLLRKYGFHVVTYPYTSDKKNIFISKVDPKFSPTRDHVIVGKRLGYLTPHDVYDDTSHKKKYFIHINIKFKNNNGKVLTTQVLNQAVFDKSIPTMKLYLKKYMEGIKKIPIPKQFTIIEISESIVAVK